MSDEAGMPQKEIKTRRVTAITFRMAQYGELMQVELDALPPETMRGLYKEALDEFFDYEAWEEVKKQEDEELIKLDQTREEFGLSTKDLMRGRMKAANTQTLDAMARLIRDIKKERKR